MTELQNMKHRLIDAPKNDDNESSSSEETVEVEEVVQHTKNRWLKGMFLLTLLIAYFIRLKYVEQKNCMKACLSTKSECIVYHYTVPQIMYFENNTNLVTGFEDVYIVHSIDYPHLRYALQGDVGFIEMGKQSCYTYGLSIPHNMCNKLCNLVNF